MIRLAVPTACLVGCGRLDFGAVSVPDAPRGHDEDGDGIADSVDTCPHVAGSNTDTDGDGVGDACDPDPTTPGDHIAVFSPLEPGTNPFDDITEFMQAADALNHTGDASLYLTRPFGSARIEIGFDIVTIIGTGQHQIGVGIERGTPYYFAELNDNGGGAMHNCSIISYDATNGYIALDSTDSPPLHTGRGIMRLDVNATTSTFATTAGWDGELYSAMAATPGYTGGTQLHYSLNGLELAIRYIIIIDSP